MVQYVIQRTLQTVVVLLFLTLFCFLLLHFIPGDPVLQILGEEATEEEIQKLRQELGLDKPVLVQYWNWLTDVLRGDLGTSIIYRESVSSLILHRLTPTLHIGLTAIAISIIFGVTFGILAAIWRGSWVDGLISTTANIGLAIPNFWLGILGIYFIGLKLGWLPIQGYVSPTEDFWLSTQYILMPALILGFSSMSVLARQTRSSMLEVIRQDYIRTARSKGLKKSVIILKHALKNAFIPIITLCGLMLPNVIGGSVIIEQVFNINGVGRLMLSSVFNQDIVVIQGCLIVIGVAVALANLLVDLSYGYLDPRIRYK